MQDSTYHMIISHLCSNFLKSKIVHLTSFNVVIDVNLLFELTLFIYISLNGCVLMVLVTYFMRNHMIGTP